MAVGPDYAGPPAQEELPKQWGAKVPKGTRELELERWWRQIFDDSLLSELIEHAQQSNPRVDQAIARIRQSRALVQTQSAAQLPALQGTAAYDRSGGLRRKDKLPLVTTSSGILDASWEIDLFGGMRRSVAAANANLQASEALWHDARVSLAAEVASAYASRRECEALGELAESDLRSRTEAHRLTLQKLDAGFASPADADLTEASAADASSILKSQVAICDQVLNQLVKLTGLDRSDLTTRLLGQRAQINQVQDISFSLVPASAISQRPDIAAAERTLAAASANIGVAKASRLPSLQLLGSIGVNQTRTNVTTTKVQPWSFNPSLSLPIFDGGRGKAAVEQAYGVYDEAVAIYTERVREAVEEIENALVRIDVAEERLKDIERSKEGYTRFFAATEVQYREGVMGVLGLEQARSTLLASQQALIIEQVERIQSWIALYKAVGGGWFDESIASSANK